MKYVILLLDTEAAKNMTEAEGQAWYAEIGAWYEKGGGGTGKLVEGGHQLQPPATAKTVRASGVTDGPFMETKEALGGLLGHRDRHHRRGRGGREDLARGGPGLDDGRGPARRGDVTPAVGR